MNQIHRLGDHKKGLLNNSKFSIFLIILILILIAVIYYFYQLNQKYINQNNICKTETEALKANLDDLNQKYADVLNKIDVTEKEKLLIFSSLNGLASEYSGLMQNYDSKVNQVATLEKTLYIDDELLKKYSKYYFLNENYTPSSTELINPTYTLNNKDVPILSNIRSKVETMMQDARNSNINLVIHSGYRSFEEQKGLKGNYVQTFGLTKSNQFSADQGYSEHQLGTALDLSDGKTGLAVAFDKTDTFKWMVDNAYRYGFILSYNKNNPYYQYEPWHWRYVGVALATYMKNNNLKFYDMDQKEIDKYKVNIFD